MTCKLIRTRLADYSARRLAPSEAAEVRSHLDSCNACALFLREEAALARGLERLSLVEPSADLWSRVSAGLDAPEMQPQHSRRFVWGWGRTSLAALMTGAAATAGLVAFTYLNAPDAPIPVPKAGPKIAVADRGGPSPNLTPSPISGPSREVNRSLDDPMADQMDTLFATVDQMTSTP